MQTINQWALVGVDPGAAGSILRKRRAALLAFSILILVGCSSGAGTPPPSESSTPATSTSAADHSTGTPDTIEPASASIDDKKGDTAAGDITKVGLDRTANELRVTFTLVKPLPEAGSSGVFLNLSNPDGSVAMQTGVKWLDGAQIAYFVFDLGSAIQQNLSGEALVKGETIVATFPVDSLSPLGNLWEVQAVSSIDGKDADTAPEPGDDVLNPNRVTLGT